MLWNISSMIYFWFDPCTILAKCNSKLIDELTMTYTLLQDALDNVPLEHLAVAESLENARKEKELMTKHQKKLDKILHVNGYKRISVPSQGDCFFVSTMMQMQYDSQDDGVEVLRDLCSKHIRNNKMKYQPWIGHTKEEDFQEWLTALATKGLWNNALMDLMPYVISNMFQCTLLVFRSTNDNPYEKVVPTLPLSHATDSIFKLKKSHVILAYNQGIEHYDYAVPIKGEGSMDIT